MKTEVLKKIKEAEESYRIAISEAEKRKREMISDAELEAENLIKKAKHDAEEYRKQRLADARKMASAKYAEIVGTGERQCASIKNQGATHLDQATDLLVSRLMEQLHVKG